MALNYEMGLLGTLDLRCFCCWVCRLFMLSPVCKFGLLVPWFVGVNFLGLFCVVLGLLYTLVFCPGLNVLLTRCCIGVFAWELCI